MKDEISRRRLEDPTFQAIKGSLPRGIPNGVINLIREMGMGYLKECARCNETMLISRENAIKIMDVMAKNINECEKVRCGMVSYGAPDFIQYAHARKSM